MQVEQETDDSLDKGYRHSMGDLRGGDANRGLRPPAVPNSIHSRMPPKTSILKEKHKKMPVR